jgi:hypothetical protein
MDRQGAQRVLGRLGAFHHEKLPRGGGVHGLHRIRETREVAEMLTHVTIEVCKRLPRTDWTAQMVIGASLMQAMKRSMKECLVGEEPLCVFW